MKDFFDYDGDGELNSVEMATLYTTFFDTREDDPSYSDESDALYEDADIGEEYDAEEGSPANDFIGAGVYMADDDEDEAAEEDAVDFQGKLASIADSLLELKFDLETVRDDLEGNDDYDYEAGELNSIAFDLDMLIDRINALSW